jgi:hypothetical protein
LKGAIGIVDRLQRVLEHLAAADDPDCTWFADIARLWLAGAPWDGALGLADGWRRVLQQRDQERALRALAAAVSGSTARERARQIATLLNRYETSGWRVDRITGHRPDGVEGHARDYLAADGATSFERLRKLDLGSRSDVTRPTPSLRAARTS